MTVVIFPGNKKRLEAEAANEAETEDQEMEVPKDEEGAMIVDEIEIETKEDEFRECIVCQEGELKDEFTGELSEAKVTHRTGVLIFKICLFF